MSHAELFYYSGTGNTGRAIGILAGELVRGGWTVTLTDMGTGDLPAAPGPGDMLVIGFPSLGFSPPATVLERLRRLPPAETGENGPVAAILVACGSGVDRRGKIGPGWSGAAWRTAAGALGRRGYRTVASEEVSYADNWTQMIAPRDDAVSATMTEAGDTAARAFGADLASGRFRVIGRRPVVLAASAPVGWTFRTVARRVLVRLYGSDSSCTGCGLCARTCPSGAIGMENGRPVWNTRCSVCNRCINACPTRSIQTTKARLVLIGGLNLALVLGSRPVAAGILAAVAPAAADPSLRTGRGIATTALGLGLYLCATLIQIGPFDRLLRAFERFPPTARLFGASTTKTRRRYLAPGFTPGDRPYRPSRRPRS